MSFRTTVTIVFLSWLFMAPAGCHEITTEQDAGLDGGDNTDDNADNTIDTNVDNTTDSQSDLTGDTESTSDSDSQDSESNNDNLDGGQSEDSDSEIDTDSQTEDDTDSTCESIPCPFTEPNKQLYVISLGNDAADGLSWATGFSTLQKAVDTGYCYAKACSMTIDIWVALGTYSVYQSGPKDTLILKPNVALYGGFKGNEQTIALRDPQKNPTIISGQNPQDTTQTVHHVIFGSDNAAINGFTISGGNAATAGQTNSCGGGMLNINSAPLVENCLFQNNAAGPCGGGGMYNLNASPSINNCVFRGNTAQSGGALKNVNSSPAIANCRFMDNTALKNGGAMENQTSTPLISQSRFLNNTCDGYGGALFNTLDSLLILNRCYFISNWSEGGGAIGNEQSSLTIENTVFEDNTAYWGGAVYLQNSKMAQITNCTLVNNYAEETGGSLLQFGDNQHSQTTIANSILWNNHPNEISLSNSLNPIESQILVSHSDISTPYPGDQNISMDPLFSYDLDYSWLLSEKSPCIDRGDDAVAPKTDIIQNSRVDIEGTGIAGKICDMGAFEYQPER